MRKKLARCSKCGRILTDPYSIAVGMGPECRGSAGRSGASFPKPLWKVSGGRVTFLGVEGSVTPSGEVKMSTNAVWVQPVDSEDAHWIKITRDRYLEAACGKIIPRQGSKAVLIERVGLAGAPGRTFTRPIEGKICKNCEDRSKAQA